MKLDPGDTFGRYRIEALLGQGGMGRVYRAHDTHLCRNVALKVLPWMGSAEAQARVLGEARAAAALQHPHVVAIFDVGEASTADGEDVPYIAMELVEGRDLRALAAEGAIDRATLLRWLASVARALGAAHRLGLVHRDVKPANVVVRGDGTVRVIDFGLAHHASVVEEEPCSSPMAVSVALADEDLVRGTPLYMAPEHLLGEPLDGRADQFSWAVMAYELVTGSLPWKNEDSVRVVAEILAARPAAICAVAPEVPAGVAAVIERALSRDPLRRFLTMDDAADALDAAAAGALPIQAAVTGDVPAARPRRVGLVALAGAVVAVVLGVAAWQTAHRPGPLASSSPPGAPFVAPTPACVEAPATVEQALAVVAERAAVDGRWDVAGQAVHELEARRTAGAEVDGSRHGETGRRGSSYGSRPRCAGSAGRSVGR